MDAPQVAPVSMPSAPNPPDHVIGPLGEPLTIERLPPATATRWVVRRKAEVVAAVEGGLLSLDEVCRRYRLSEEEYAGWRAAVARSGLAGLRITRLQHYRALPPQPAVEDSIAA